MLPTASLLQLGLLGSARLASVSLVAASVQAGGASSSSATANGEFLDVTASRLEALAANLQEEVMRLRRERERWQGQGHEPVDGEVMRGAGEEHGRTLFFTVCAGSSHFNTFCGPLLASFERAYRTDARRHRLVALTTQVEPSILRAAEARYAPWAHFEPFDNVDGSFKITETSTPGSWNNAEVVCLPGKEGKARSCRPKADDGGMQDKDLKTTENCILKFKRAGAYLREHGREFQYSVLLDSDILFVKPLTQYLPTSGVDWDVAFCAYDEEFKTPWAATAMEVGATAHGFRRLNAGVMLFNLRDEALVRRFLHRLALVATLIITGGRNRPAEEQPLWTHWQKELLDEFRGADPAALALLASSYNTDKLSTLLGWDDCLICRETVQAQLVLYDDETPMSIQFRAFPARVLNHAESMFEGTFPSDVLLVHLKGMWWRMMLNSNIVGYDAHRQPDWNRDALMLHRICFSEWQFVLPPEQRSIPPVTSYDVECRNLA